MDDKSPTGMWELAQCGRTLHVGPNTMYLRTTKKTSPALHIDINGDGVADFFGNLSTQNTPINVGTTNMLKVNINGTTYFIHDDTVGGM